MPLAAISVATSILNEPLRKPSSAALLILNILPCRDVAMCPAFSTAAPHSIARCFVRVNTSTDPVSGVSEASSKVCFYDDVRPGTMHAIPSSMVWYGLFVL